ncbi:unnamed protein product [Clonostachys solani]|uniref:Uncharacterized protein n=1 Tax=Clonostachys solani TaxID=160281 RepID=A0A9N9ZFI7_9HYPO|nr:unnamed protein product [Clonostachys solani]
MADGEIAEVKHPFLLPSQIPYCGSPLVQPVGMRNAACSLELSSTDHEAIRYFRKTVATIHHTKNPEFSVYAIIFDIAKDNAMVMHLVLALGGREIEFRRNTITGRADDRGPESPLQHYCAALRLVSESLEMQQRGLGDLEALCSALFLMLMYEQKFGDVQGLGLTNHLNGAAWVITHYCKEIAASIVGAVGRAARPAALARKSHAPSQRSLFMARLFIWIAIQDAAASTFRLGGQLNRALHQAINIQDSAPWENFERINLFSSPLYRIMWADRYPQVELLDDIENHHIYGLLCASSQLRCMVANFSLLDDLGKQRQEPVIENAIEKVGYYYNDLFQVAGGLSLDTDNSHRLVANIRGIVPHYYAVVLEFHRANPRRKPQGQVQEIIELIMSLAAQDYRHGGDGSMVRIAWPLFVTAIVTDKCRYHDWIRNRLQSISKYGKNYERAYQYLVKMSQVGNAVGSRAGALEALDSVGLEAFVI